MLIRLSASIDSSNGIQKLYFDSGTKLWNDIGVNEKGIRCSSAVRGECRSTLLRPLNRNKNQLKLKQKSHKNNLFLG